ncbi:hypothetical protein KI387_026899, partial [Taxus chinensis]
HLSSSIGVNQVHSGGVGSDWDSIRDCALHIYHCHAFDHIQLLEIAVVQAKSARSNFSVLASLSVFPR